MENIRGKTLIINGNTADASGYAPDPSADLFYEVLRVINGKYLFLEDHLERLQSSCGESIPEYPGSSYISLHLMQLIQSSDIREGNVRLLIYKDTRQVNVVCFFISHFYPALEDFQVGVKVKSFAFERPDPTIKRWNELFRKRVNLFIKNENIYEALLINEEGMLTEGSRSNLFFIDNENRVISAPEVQVLPGITRKYVFQICKELGISLVERAINFNEVSAMTGCFISGTSPKVLPVQKLDGITFDAKHNLIQKISQSFNQMIIESLG
jgi:branched-chain amino acid aminotransferase